MDFSVFRGRLDGKRGTLIAAAVLLLAISAAYANSFTGSFHFDDLHQIVENPNLRDIRNLPLFFTSPGAGSATPGDEGYRPVLCSTFGLDYLVSGGRSWSFHITNTAIHFLNALLLFFIVRAVFRKAGNKEAGWAPLFVSLAFALHPVQTAAVTYISGRSAVLAAFFSLLSVLGFVRFKEDGPARHGWLVLSVLSFFIGLLTKETAVSCIGLIFLFLLVFPGRDGRIKRFAALIPYSGALILFLVLKKALQGFYVVSGAPHGIMEYFISELKVFLLYLRLLFLPVNQSADYNLPVSGTFDLKAASSVIIISAALIYLWKSRRRNPAGAFFGLWFLAALAPESSLIPITDTAVEYRLYLPLAGFVACAAAFSGGLMTRRSISFAAAALVLFGVLAYNRNNVWADEYSFWSDALLKAPLSARAHIGLGSALMDKGEHEAALREFLKALKVETLYDRAGTYNDIGLCYINLGKPGEAEQSFIAGTVSDPEMYMNYNNLGGLYLSNGEYGKAAGFLEKALKIRPGYFQAMTNLANCYINTGRKEDALRELDAASEVAPPDFDARVLLTTLYGSLGQMDKAAGQARAALNLAGDGGQRADAEALLARLGKR